MMRWLRDIRSGVSDTNKSDGADEPSSSFSDQDMALRRASLYVILPLWFVPGIADWVWHRRTKIEQTAGTFESLTHLFMQTSVGIPVVLTLFCDINALVITSMISGSVAHEGISFLDIRYAEGRREVPPIEQHTHSFLEMLPFMATLVVVCLEPRQFASIFRLSNERPRWKLEPKRPAITLRYRVGILCAVALFVMVPYTEEFVRCFRIDHTLRPHRTPES